MGVPLGQNYLWLQAIQFKIGQAHRSSLCHLNRPSAPLTKRARHFFSGRLQANAHHLLDQLTENELISPESLLCSGYPAA